MEDDFQNQLKEARRFRWEKFAEADAAAKLLTLEVIMMMKTNNDEFPLAINIKNPGSNFDSIIFELISKAQLTPDNYYRLMLAFPEYVKLWEEWQDTPNQEDFFNKYGV